MCGFLMLFLWRWTGLFRSGMSIKLISRDLGSVVAIEFAIYLWHLVALLFNVYFMWAAC
jgi:hypothetical protein